MAPEYAWHGQFSVKSDVFSFGVLVLEIVTGQKNNRAQTNEDISESLISYVSTNFMPFLFLFGEILAYKSRWK